MKNSLLYVIGLLGLVVISMLVYFFVDKSDDDVQSASEEKVSLISFIAKEGDFIVAATNASKIQISVLPTGTEIEEGDAVVIGDMIKVSEKEGSQIWKLSVPEEEMSVSEIIATAYDASGAKEGNIKFPASGATEIHSLLWGNIEEIEPASIDETWVAKLGENKVFGNTSIKVNQVVEDSRCPRGAQCIQAGRARIEVAVTTNGATETRTITERESITVAGGLLTVQKVEPYPDLQVTTRASDYRFTLSFKR